LTGVACPVLEAIVRVNPVPPLLSTVLAQTTAVETLRRALRGGRVHHAYLFDGPDGVGKERAALGLAQALLCERREEGESDACGVCSACARVHPLVGKALPEHPDLIILERGLYPAAQIGRRTDETQDLSIDQVRTLVLARSAFGSHEGKAKVFILRRAEELSVQASNALLKTLEEPGRGTHFVLLSSRADSLLTTIRSRTQRVRFNALPNAVVLDLLTAQGVAKEHATAIAKLARGSMQLAASLADPDESEARDAFASRALSALEAKDLGPALELAEEAKKSKEGLDTRILALAARLADNALQSARAGIPGAEQDAIRYGLALSAVTELRGNASAQLVVESMLARMRSVC
jgi:DNA polymerase-3 subunit delta'